MNDPILITVNEQTLTKSQAENLARETIMRQGIPPQMVDQYLQQAGDQIEEQAVEQFINQTLLRAEAESRQAPVGDNEIEAAIFQLSQQLPEGMTLEQAIQAQGMTMDAMRKDIAINERIRKLYETETAEVADATDDQVAAFYKEHADEFKTDEAVDAKHILIKCELSDSTEAQTAAQTEAEAIHKELVDGADFADIAAARSACPSGKQGGSLGTMQRGRMVPEFEKAAFEQEVNEIGPVVKTQFGYHIVQITDKKPAGVIPQEEATEQIREGLKAQARDERFAEFLMALRDNATIEHGDPTGGIIIP